MRNLILINKENRKKIVILPILFLFLFSISLTFVSSSYSDCSIYGNCKPVSVVSTGTGTTINNYTNNYINQTVNDTFIANYSLFKLHYFNVSNFTVTRTADRLCKFKADTWLLDCDTDVTDFLTVLNYAIQNQSLINYDVYQDNIMNTSMQNYVLYVNSTNGAGGGTSYTPPFTEWINVSSTNYTSTSSTVMTHITNLNMSIPANTKHKFECWMVYQTNITTNGMRVGMAIYPAPALIWYTAKLDQAADGTDAYFEGSGTTAFDNITSTAVAAANTNYSVRINGIVGGTANIWINPYMLSENNTRLSQTTTQFCRWTRLI